MLVCLCVCLLVKFFVCVFDRLFLSAIVHRIVIKKAVRDQDDVTAHSLSALTFFRKYPRFLDFFSAHLVSILDREFRDLPKHRSAVTYAMLSLISKLLPPPSLPLASQSNSSNVSLLERGSIEAGDEYLSTRIRSIIPVICRISYSSRDFHLRTTIGKSLTRLIPCDSAASLICSLISRVTQICGLDTQISFDDSDLIPKHNCDDDPCCISSNTIENESTHYLGVTCRHNALHSLLSLLRSLLTFHFRPSKLSHASSPSPSLDEIDREKAFASLFVTRSIGDSSNSTECTFNVSIAKLILSYPVLLRISDLAPPIGVTLAEIFLIMIQNGWVSQIPPNARDYLRYLFCISLFGTEFPQNSNFSNGSRRQTSRPMSSLYRSKVCEILFSTEIFCPYLFAPNQIEWADTHRRIVTLALSDTSLSYSLSFILTHKHTHAHTHSRCEGMHIHTHIHSPFIQSLFQRIYLM